MSGPAKKAFPLRLDPALYAALERVAAGDFRSVNAQVEVLLREALAGRKDDLADMFISMSCKGAIKAGQRLADLFKVLFAEGNLAGQDVAMLAQRKGGCLDGGNDALIAAAAANHIVHRSADFVKSGVGVGFEQGVCFHQLPGRAKTALNRAVGDEGFLQGMERFEVFALVLLMVRTQGAQPFDG